MALTPSTASDLAAGVLQAAEEAERRIIEKIAKRVAKGGAAPDWAIRKQAELQALRAQVTAEINALSKQLEREIPLAVNGGYQLGVEGAADDLAGANITPGTGVLPAARAAAVASLVADTTKTLRGFTAQVLRDVEDIYQKVIKDVAPSVLLGTSTRLEATQRALDKFAAGGVTAFRDSAGRRWTMPAYAEMAVRTSTGQAAIKGHVDTLTAAGQQLVHIVPGPRPCDLCDDWAGKILLASGTDLTVQTPTGTVTAFATLAEARSQGWGHPNCRCTIALYVPGFSTLSTDRPGVDGYEDGQRQRAIERKIREWKLKEAAAVTPQGRARAKAKVREWQGEMRAHLKAHPDLRRLSHREQIRRGVARKDIPVVLPQPPSIAPVRPALSVVPEPDRMPYTLKPDLANTNQYGTWEERVARGVSAGDFASEQDLFSHMAREMRSASMEAIKVEIEPKAFGSILQDGKFKNLREVRANDAFLTNRDHIEYDTFGVPRDAKVSDMPVYGFMRGYIDGRAGYGPVTVELKDSVRARTTITAGDSFSSDVPAAPLNSVHDMSDERLAQSAHLMTPKFDERLGYIEAQIHGGITLNDIEVIRIPQGLWEGRGWGSLNAQQRQAVQDAGIRVVFEEWE